MVITNKKAFIVVINCLFTGLIFDIEGGPGKILSNNGSEFKIEEMCALSKAFNIRSINTAAKSLVMDIRAL